MLLKPKSTLAGNTASPQLKKMDASFFHSSALLLIMIFVTTLSKYMYVTTSVWAWLLPYS